jgi:hypothetical protein
METREFFSLLRKEMVECLAVNPSLQKEGLQIGSISLELYLKLNKEATNISLKHTNDLFLSGKNEPIYFRYRVKAEHLTH